MMLKTDFTISQYDVLEGSFPSNANELALIVSDTNQLLASVLEDLGIKKIGEEKTNYPFSAVINHEYKLASNDEIYEYEDDVFTERAATKIEFVESDTLKIVGVLRVKPTTDGGVLSNGIRLLTRTLL